MEIRTYKMKTRTNLLNGSWDPSCYNTHFIQWTTISYWVHLDDISMWFL